MNTIVAGPSRQELAALAQTLVALVQRLGEDLVEATSRCEQCDGLAACDACFAALQTTLRYHRLAREIEARLATVANGVSAPAAPRSDVLPDA